MKNKLCMYLLLGVFALSLSGCGKKEETESVANAPEEVIQGEVNEPEENFVEESIEVIEEVTSEEVIEQEETVVEEVVEKKEEFYLYKELGEEIETVYIDGQSYIVYENAVVWVLDETMIIPTEVDYEGKTYPVVGIKTNGSFSVDELIIPEHIKYICQAMRYAEVSTINIPSTIEYMEAGAFSLDDSLEYIYFPEGLEWYRYNSVWSSAFEGCSNLKQITIPEGARRLMRTFTGCGSLEEVNLPESLEIIEDTSFENCKSLTNIDIPDNVSKIGIMAFAMCDGLTEIRLPQNLKELGHNVFLQCDNLTKIIVPSSVSDDIFSELQEDYPDIEIVRE